MWRDRPFGVLVARAAFHAPLARPDRPIARTHRRTHARTHRRTHRRTRPARATGAQATAELAEALPYLQRFAGETVVVKYGGAAMKDESLKDRVIRDLVLLSTVGIRPVLVHGGGPEINQWLNKVGIEAKFLNGLRVTDAATMEIVEMVLGAFSSFLPHADWFPYDRVRVVNFIP